MEKTDLGIFYANNSDLGTREPELWLKLPRYHFLFKSQSLSSEPNTVFWA